MKKKIFKVGNGFFPVDEKKHLKDFLNPATPGTKYWQSKPKSKPNKRQFARVILQIHQLLHFVYLLRVNLNNKNFLDIGTGNGLIPKLIDIFFNTKNCYGIDPYADGENITSWQAHDRNEFFNKTKNYFLEKKGGKHYIFDHKKYKSLLKREQYQFYPKFLKIEKTTNINNYKFKKLSVEKIHKLNLKFDFIYCKAFEHIGNSEKFFMKISKILNKNGVIYLKHRSFFSYLGAHRYASTSIPWGHVLLKDIDYKKYCIKFCKKRSKKMLNFYYNSLTYPRVTINDILQLASKFDLKYNFKEALLDGPDVCLT